MMRKMMHRHRAYLSTGKLKRARGKERCALRLLRVLPYQVTSRQIPATVFFARSRNGELVHFSRIFAD